MRAGLVLIVIHALACGRVGFDGSDIGEPGGDGSVPPTQIAVRVLGAPGDLDAGTPIAGATVVVVDGNGPTVHVTNAAGYMIADVAGTATLHVGYRTEVASDLVAGGEWRLYTLVDIVGGSLVSLGYADTWTDITIEVDVPVMQLATRYELRGPKRCGIDGAGTGPLVATAVNGCDGETIPIFALALDTNGPLGWLSAGNLSATDGAQYTAAGTWEPFDTQTIRFTNIPSTILIGAELVHELGPHDRVVLGEDNTQIAPGDHDQPATTFAIPADSVRAMYASSASPTSFGIVAEAATQIGGVIPFDGSRLVRVVDSITVEPDGAVSWTYTPLARDPTVTFAQLAYQTLEGVPARWILSTPMASRAEVPALPAPLDMIAPMPLTVEATILGMIVGDRTYPELAPAIFDTLAQVELIDDIPTGWAVSAAFLQGPSSRTTPRSRMERLVRRALSADD
ncbi:MAG: carboxypeptidase-like regulatory domain-containing protein [Kofleriaceae bacterium]